MRDNVIYYHEYNLPHNDVINLLFSNSTFKSKALKSNMLSFVIYNFHGLMYIDRCYNGGKISVASGLIYKNRQEDYFLQCNYPYSLLMSEVI